MARQIKRDAFGRRTLMRRNSVYTFCTYCGKGAEHGRTNYAYRWEPDQLAPQTGAWSKPFCSVGCYRAYTD